MDDPWIWVAVAVFAVLVLLFGITNTWGVIFFIILLILVGVGIGKIMKGRVKTEKGQITIKTPTT